MMNLDKPKKDLALILEIGFGLFFILGVGWLYAGNKVRGGALLAGSVLASAPSMFSIIAATGGFGFCFCALPMYLFLILDILSLRKWLEHPIIESFGSLFKKGCILYLLFIALIVVGLILLAIRLPVIINFLQRRF